MFIESSLLKQAFAGAIEQVLNTYPDHSYRRTFAIPNLREKLITRVMKQIQAHSEIVETLVPVQPEQVCCSLKQQLQIEALVEQSIYHLLQENPYWDSRHLALRVDPSNIASHGLG